MNLPYWDWTVENLNTAGTDSLIWANDFLGGPGDPADNFLVTTGPFAAWGIRRNNFNKFQSPGGGGQITTLKAQLRYTDFRGVESPHGGAHVWVGGDMGSVPTAVRDPTFFLLHCNVDRLWAEWTRDHTGQAGWVQYEPTSGGQQGHNLNDTMWPWNGTNVPVPVPPWNTTPENVHPADLLDHRVVNFYDTIDPECAPKLKDRLPKELVKDRLPKEFKERSPKETGKDNLPKEGTKDRLPKELVKERFPKEIKEGGQGTRAEGAQGHPRGTAEACVRGRSEDQRTDRSRAIPGDRPWRLHLAGAPARLERCRVRLRPRRRERDRRVAETTRRPRRLTRRTGWCCVAPTTSTRCGRPLPFVK